MALFFISNNNENEWVGVDDEETVEAIGNKLLAMRIGNQNGMRTRHAQCSLFLCWPRLRASAVTRDA